MGAGRFPGNGIATHAWTEALGGFGCIHGVDFTEPYPKHVHARLVIAEIERGSVRLLMRNRWYDAPAGSVVLINAYRVHAEDWHLGSFRALYLSRENLLQASPPATPEPWFEHPVFFDPAISRQVRDVHDAVESAMPASFVEDKTADLLRELRSGMSVLTEMLSRPILAARERLHANLAEPPTMIDLSRAADRSPYHLIRSFGRAVGLPPHAYFDQLRIAHAKERITLGHRLSDTAYALGYCDQSHFTRSFKKAALVTPGQYQQMVRSGHPA